MRRLAIIHRTTGTAVADSLTVVELGTVVSQQIGRLVPHDGYILTALDPVTGAGMFYAKRYWYSPTAARRFLVDDELGVDPVPFHRLVSGPNKAGVLSTKEPNARLSAGRCEVMAGEGVGSEMRIALVDRGIAWGSLGLVRGLDARPFSVAEAGLAQNLVGPIFAALKGFVTSLPCQASRHHTTPGVVVVGPDDPATQTTPSAQVWLAEVAQYLPGDAFHTVLQYLALMFRQTKITTLARIPTPRGWVALHTEPLSGGTSDQLAVTIQRAGGAILLPAIAAWHGITPREHAVIEHALNGLSTRQIASQLHLSPYTVNDHFKAIYRKVGVSSREELLAVMGR